MQAAGNRNLLVPSATNRGLKLLYRAALLIISSALFYASRFSAESSRAGKMPSRNASRHRKGHLRQHRRG